MADKGGGTVTHGGVGVAGLLGVAFVVLKLTEIIDWSWWWVTAPFWIPVALLVLLLPLIIIGAVAGSKPKPKWRV